MNRHGMKGDALSTPREQLRRGAFMVLAVVCLVTAMGFVSLCVDVGYLSLAKQRMQNGVDAAALAAAMEITDAVQNADATVGDVMAYAASKARLKARDVAALNGIYIDPARDVQFGQRTSAGNGQFSMSWGTAPYNVVKVTAHRNNSNANAPDAKLKLFFAGVLGDKTASLSTSAAAYVESRDIVCVLDFSGSMNDDSTYAMLGTRDRAALEANMKDIYDILDGLKDFGDLDFEPEWLTQTASSGQVNGSVVFRNTLVDVSTNQPMTSVKVTYANNGGTSTKTFASSEGITEYSTPSQSKTIDRVDVQVKLENWGKTMTRSASSDGKTANVTFNGNSNISVTTSQTMSSIRFVYYPNNTTSTVSASGKSATATGNGNYISQVQVKMGSTWVTVNNPNGSQPTITTENMTFIDSTANVRSYFGLTRAYPWAQGSWTEFVDYCRSDSQINSAGYRRKYGGKCLVNYLLTQRELFSETADLWRTPHYPFHSLKQGALLFADFLEELSFGDEVGFVSYDSGYRTEHSLNYDGYNINMSANPINNQFSNFKELVRHKQAGHYDIYTNIGGGLKQGKTLLDESARPGTQPTILLITDGLPNKRDDNFTFPSNWNWATLFDYDRNGTADYTTNDQYARFALVKAKEAVDAGYTIHTLSVGTGADKDLMQAIAWMGKGVAINVPGDSSVAQMEAEVLEAFNRIAAFVPPAKLIKTE